MTQPPDENEQNAVPLQSILTQKSTLMVSKARSKIVRMREEPELPQGKRVSLLVTEGPIAKRVVMEKSFWVPGGTRSGVDGLVNLTGAVDATRL